MDQQSHITNHTALTDTMTSVVALGTRTKGKANTGHFVLQNSIRIEIDGGTERYMDGPDERTDEKG